MILNNYLHNLYILEEKSGVILNLDNIDSIIPPSLIILTLDTIDIDRQLIPSFWSHKIA